MLAVVMVSAFIAASAQTESERYEQRYDLLVSKLGPAGIGVETVLNNWEKVDALNPKMLLGKFAYLFTKAVLECQNRFHAEIFLIWLRDHLRSLRFYEIIAEAS